MITYRMLPFLVGLLIGHVVTAQGTLDFSNLTIPGRPKITLADGTPIEGDQYLIDLLVKNPITDEFTRAGLLRVTSQGEVPTTPVNPFPAPNAGLFRGGSIKVGFLAPSSDATVRIIAWDTRTGDTYESASIRGASTFLVQNLGGAGSPPTLPAILYNFTGLILVPEPGEWVLLAVGLGLGFVLHATRWKSVQGESELPLEAQSRSNFRRRM